MPLFLPTPRAQSYYERVRALPILDFHNHVSIEVLQKDKPFANLCDLWIAPDPYKHRAMRICGVPEQRITGSCAPFETFESWCGIFPRLVGNPLYVWSQMELELLLGHPVSISRATARSIWEEASMPTPSALMRAFGVEQSAPCMGICEDPSRLSGVENTVPSLRADQALSPSEESVERLRQASRQRIETFADYLDALDSRIAAFDAAGCSFVDHALDASFHYLPDDGKNASRFSLAMNGSLPREEAAALQSAILRALMASYARRGLTLQLHLGALRHTSARLRAAAGAAGGFAAIGSVDREGLISLLNDAEQAHSLPKTVLFPLDPAENAAMAVLSGSFPGDGTEGRVSLGPAWWWCDHAFGIENVLDSVANFGVLSEFIGMTTDSRSLLSFVRHDCFRRVLCRWLAERVERGDFPEDEAAIDSLLQKICYGNARKAIRKGASL